MEWIKVTEDLPKELETVWAYDQESKMVALACVSYDDGLWFWAVSNGIIYAEGNKIVSECEMDDYNFTHWKRLPELPIKK